MAETLEQFIVRRRGELDAEFARFQAEIAAIEAEREQLDRVAVMIGLPDSGPSPGRTFSVQERTPQKRLSEATIKGMVLNVLLGFPQGQTALEILDRINRTVDPPYPRTSLSPQLSRLKAEGKIHRVGRVWILGSGPDQGGNDPDEGQGEERASLQEPDDNGADLI